MIKNKQRSENATIKCPKMSKKRQGELLKEKRGSKENEKSYVQSISTFHGFIVAYNGSLQ